MAFSVQSLWASLPQLSIWGQGQQEQPRCTSVLLRLPTDPLAAAGELRQSGNAQVSQLRDHARRSPEDASIEERSQKWTAYALSLSKADSAVRFASSYANQCATWQPALASPFSVFNWCCRRRGRPSGSVLEKLLKSRACTTSSRW